MTAAEYGSGLERVAGWNPAVVTIENAEKDYDSLRVKIPPDRGDAGSNPLNAWLGYLQGSRLKLYLYIVVYNAIADAKG